MYPLSCPSVYMQAIASPVLTEEMKCLESRSVIITMSTSGKHGRAAQMGSTHSRRGNPR